MTPTLILHAGAGVWPEELRADAQDAIERCADAAWAHMGEGALATVIAAVSLMEDEPLFNAGIGAALTSAGTIEHDAGVMDGRDLRAGGIGSVLGPRHPVDLAVAVMEQTPHVLLVGPGALEFGRHAGVEMVDDPAIFLTDRRRAGLLTSDTVGAVALDAGGHAAAAVSTGGYTGKMPGRVGDSPIPGAGFYADDRAGVSCATGTGEGFIRLALARQVHDAMLDGTSAQASVEAALAELRDRVGMTGGMIAIDRAGGVGRAHSTDHMPTAIRRGAQG